MSTPCSLSGTLPDRLFEWPLLRTVDLVRNEATPAFCAPAWLRLHMVWRQQAPAAGGPGCMAAVAAPHLTLLIL